MHPHFTLPNQDDDELSYGYGYPQQQNNPNNPNNRDPYPAVYTESGLNPGGGEKGHSSSSDQHLGVSSSTEESLNPRPLDPSDAGFFAEDDRNLQMSISESQHSSTSFTVKREKTSTPGSNLSHWDSKEDNCNYPADVSPLLTRPVTTNPNLSSPSSQGHPNNPNHPNGAMVRQGSQGSSGRVDTNKALLPPAAPAPPGHLLRRANSTPQPVQNNPNHPYNYNNSLGKNPNRPNSPNSPNNPGSPWRMNQQVAVPPFHPSPNAHGLSGPHAHGGAGFLGTMGTFEGWLERKTTNRSGVHLSLSLSLSLSLFLSFSRSFYSCFLSSYLCLV